MREYGRWKISTQTISKVLFKIKNNLNQNFTVIRINHCNGLMVGLQMKLLIKKHSENMRGTVENKHSDNIKVCLHLYIIEKTEHDHFRILVR